MKKLLFAAVTLDVGGIETALVTLLNYLVNEKENNDKKYEITLVLEKKEGVFLEGLNKNIKIIEYTPNNNKVIIIRKLINFFKQLKFKKLYTNKFDFSCAYATYSKVASFVARTASKNSALWVHTEYLNVFKNSTKDYIAFFNDIKIDKFKKIVFVSNNAKKNFINVFKNNYIKNENIEEKTELIYNLIDYNTIIKKSEEVVLDAKREEIFTFLNVGRHTEEDKRLTRIIQASKKLKQNGFKFRILFVGDGKETKNYKRMVKESDLQKEIIFVGKKKNPYPYYKIADSFLLTSEYEGFPVVYIESMMLELPIITTNVSDSMEIIEKKYGIVVEKDIASIYNAMEEAIKNGLKPKEQFNFKIYNQQIINKITKLIN